jgi:hypothetical protein
LRDQHREKSVFAESGRARAFSSQLDYVFVLGKNMPPRDSEANLGLAEIFLIADLHTKHSGFSLIDAS